MLYFLVFRLERLHPRLSRVGIKFWVVTSNIWIPILLNNEAPCKTARGSGHVPHATIWGDHEDVVNLEGWAGCDVAAHLAEKSFELESCDLDAKWDRPHLSTIFSRSASNH